MRRPTVLGLPLQLVFPGWLITFTNSTYYFYHLSWKPKWEIWFRNLEYRSAANVTNSLKLLSQWRSEIICWSVCLWLAASA